MSDDTLAALHHQTQNRPRAQTEAPPCLMCWKLFISAWAGQRICPDCKESRIWRDGEGWLPGEHQNDR